MKATIKSLVKALSACAEAHKVEFKDMSDEPGESPQALLKSESVPVQADVRLICEAFFGSASMVEVGWGFTTVFFDEKPLLSNVNEQKLALALPAGTKL